MSHQETEAIVANLPRAGHFNYADSIAYETGKKNRVVLVQRPDVAMILFAVDQGQVINRHTTPGDALVQVIDGVAHIEIGDTRHVVRAGEAILMPAYVPHELVAEQAAFKMLLTIIKDNKGGEEGK